MLSYFIGTSQSVHPVYTQHCQDTESGTWNTLTWSQHQCQCQHQFTHQNMKKASYFNLLMIESVISSTKAISYHLIEGHYSLWLFLVIKDEKVSSFFCFLLLIMIYGIKSSAKVTSHKWASHLSSEM